MSLIEIVHDNVPFRGSGNERKGGERGGGGGGGGEVGLSVPYSRESLPMGAASYFLTKQGGGRSFECFRIQP